MYAILYRSHTQNIPNVCCSFVFWNYFVFWIPWFLKFQVNLCFYYSQKITTLGSYIFVLVSTGSLIKIYLLVCVNGKNIFFLSLPGGLHIYSPFSDGSQSFLPAFILKLKSFCSSLSSFNHLNSQQIKYALFIVVHKLIMIPTII